MSKNANFRATIKLTEKRTISLLFILTIAFPLLLTAIPFVNGVNADTYPYLSATPNPIGIGQTVNIVIWMQPFPASNADRYANYSITLTRPDGTTIPFGPLVTDANGGASLRYAPDAVGTWYVQFSYPGQTMTSGNYYKPSSSPKVELIVQEDPVQFIPAVPLPDGYWTRPISAENRAWWTIAGNWLSTNSILTYNATGNFAPFTQAPNSGHIVWTRELTMGGLVGGELGEKDYNMGLSYEQKFTPPVVMNGRLYYNLYPATRKQPGVICVDLRTGQEIWRGNYTITCGQLFCYDSINQAGAFAYLWSLGATYQMYDAFTGDWMLSLANASTGTVVFDNKGTMLVYIINTKSGWLALWNSTKCFDENKLITYQSTLAKTQYGIYGGQWRPTTGTYDWRLGISWNATIPKEDISLSIAQIAGDVIAVRGAYANFGPQALAAYSMNTGQKLWGIINVTTPYIITGAGDGIFVLYNTYDLKWYAFDLNSGSALWTSDPQSYPWGMMSEYAVVAYGKLYTSAYDGCVYAFDIKTGKQAWKYSTGNAGYETPYGTYVIKDPLIVADGKVYLSQSETGPPDPYWRGGKIHCIDANTGEGIWSIANYGMVGAIADGYALFDCGYDNRIYCFGKGQTATTVSAPQVVTQKGQSVMVTGTVTDQSPGAAKDTPAISDESMSSWMEYIYMQKPIPTNATGVTVTLALLIQTATISTLQMSLLI